MPANGKDNCSSSTYYLLNRGEARNVPTLDILNESMEKIPVESHKDRPIEAQEFRIDDTRDGERSTSARKDNSVGKVNDFGGNYENKI